MKRPLPKVLVLVVLAASSCGLPRVEKDAGIDSGQADAGFDGGQDAGLDGGVDAGIDGGSDAGLDAGYDGGLAG